MATPVILGIDQGTTNTKTGLFDARTGASVGRASQPVSVSYPAPGWAEQSAEAIWDSVVASIAGLVANHPQADIAAIAISNQRETVVIWDAQTGEPIAPAISWQCRRTTAACEAFRPHAQDIERITGLGLDPLFPAAKLAWMLDNVPDARRRAEAGELRAGTIDSWLLWKLTKGGSHATDFSNASRTQLFDIDALSWSEKLLDLFGIPASLLPRALPSDADFGETSASGLPAGLPVRAILGDSHAALLGHGFSRPGAAKVTCGTGSSLMAVTGQRLRSSHGLSSTIAWSQAGNVLYALEGNVAVSGHAAAFGAQVLGLDGPDALSQLASSVDSSDGVVFVPALAGLGAPHWSADARGLFSGMSLGTTSAHLARAVIESIALQIADIVFAMDADMGERLPALSVDGGAAANDFLIQTLADVIDRPVLRPDELGLSARGAAQLAASAIGAADQGWPLSNTVTFEPQIDPGKRAEMRERWGAAIAAAKAIGS